MATAEFPNGVATAYDSTERNITNSGETKPIGEVAQQQARALVSANASNSQGMAAFMKKYSTELGAAVPELASHGKQGQLMSPPGSKSASVCQRSVSGAVNGKGSGPVLAALAAVFIAQRFLEQAGANSIELLRLNNHDPGIVCDNERASAMRHGKNAKENYFLP